MEAPSYHSRSAKTNLPPAHFYTRIALTWVLRFYKLTSRSDLWYTPREFLLGRQAMSLLRIVLLGAYLSGVVGLVLGVAMRLGLPIGDMSARGALVFSCACFLCTLATRKVTAQLEKRNE